MSWERARAGGEACGRCGGQVVAGKSVRAIYLNDRTVRKVRCQACAGEPVNEAQLVEVAPEPTPERRTWDLTRCRVERVPPLRAPVPLANIAADLPFDVRMAAAGRDDDVAFERLGGSEIPREREPGEEG